MKLNKNPICTYFRGFIWANVVMGVLAVQALAQFDVGIASSLVKVFPDGSNFGEVEPGTWASVTLAADEAESFQLVIAPNSGALESVTIELSELSGVGGKLDWRWYRVGFVKTGNPSYPVQRVGLWPDPLYRPSVFSIDADRVQPIWITVEAPPDASPGIYIGEIKVTAGQLSTTHPVRVRVRNFNLPRPGTFVAPFGLYVKTFEDYYFKSQGISGSLPIERFRDWCEYLAKYRVTPKNIAYEYRNITWANGPDGHRVVTDVDLSLLQQTLGELAFKYFPDYSYGAYRLTSGFVIEKWLDEWAPESRPTPASVAAPVQKVLKEWREAGFSDNVYVYGIDEPSPGRDDVLDFIREIYELIKKDNPNVKIMQTIGGPAPELVGLVDIWCPKTNVTDSKFFQDRIAAGDTVWTYVCVSPVPPSANFCIDEPAIDHRILFWQTYQWGATGFLYWSTTWWEGMPNPLPAVPDIRDHVMYYKHWQHHNGDGFLFYPGPDFEPIPSIRMEVVRDGIEDYEYLVLLNDLISQVEKIPDYQDQDGVRVLNRARELVRVPDSISRAHDQFTQDNSQLLNRRERVGDMIEQLVNVLTEQDYKRWNNQKPE